MSEYEDIFLSHLRKMNGLRVEEARIRTELDKVTEMLRVSFSLMTEEEQSRLLSAFTSVMETVANQELGLTEAIRTILQSSTNEWFGSVKMKDRLVQAGFDFSGYTSNPLSSVNTVLKRFKRTVVKARKDKLGFKEYRWTGPAKMSFPDASGGLYSAGAAALAGESPAIGYRPEKIGGK